jgi:hypothetical protein
MMPSPQSSKLSTTKAHTISYIFSGEALVSAADLHDSRKLPYNHSVAESRPAILKTKVSVIGGFEAQA